MNEKTSARYKTHIKYNGINADGGDTYNESSGAPIRRVKTAK
jgi:hypothetical protein